MIRHHHSLVPEAADVGLIGAGTVAAWFLLVDWAAGHALYTPSALGQILVFGRSTIEAGAVDPAAVAAYTFFHVFAFALLSATLVWLVHFAIRNPSWLVGLLILFVSVELFFYGAAYAVLSRTGAETLWWRVLVANILAVLTMGTYLWRYHRLISRWLARVPLGDTGEEAEVNTAVAWHAMARWRVPLWKRWFGRGAPGRA